MRIAFFSPPLQGHLKPASNLAEALQALGHQCFLVHHPQTAVPDVFRPIAIDAARCAWTPARFTDHIQHASLPFGILRLVRTMADMTDTFCRLAPELLQRHNIEAVVADQMEPAGALVADHLGLPYVSMAAAHPINREPLIPLPVLSWPYEDSTKAIKRNRAGAWIADKLTAQHDRTILEWSRRWNLLPRRNLVDCLSQRADISQLVRGFDFPRKELPKTFHYVGPLRSRRGASGEPAKWRKDERPLIYASLGTLQNQRLGLFQRIAETCRLLGVRAVISHADGLSARQAASIDADFVLPWVDHETILSEADAVITHGGLNTVLDALSAGVPILCLPIALEQPGIGARVERSGAGITLSPRSSVRELAEGLGKILHQPSFRVHSQRLASEFGAAGGSDAAAVIVTEALKAGTKQRVT